MLKNAYNGILLQKSASIQPRTSPPKICKMFAKFCGAARGARGFYGLSEIQKAQISPRRRRHAGALGVAVDRSDDFPRHLAAFGKISAKCCSFSAVSAPIFASKYGFCSIFQNLPDYLAEIFEI